MKKIFSILLSLALVVSLSLVAAAPVMAVELPSISPESADYDLDNPQHIAINMDFGDATDLDWIEDDDGTLTPGSDYYQFEGLVVIPEAYLDSKLDCIGDEWLFQFEFDPFGVAFLTVTAVGTAPSLEDASADWDFYSSPPDDVITGINWGCADDVVKIEEIVGGVVVDTLSQGSEWVHTATVLNITGTYLDGRLTSIGDDVELTVTFDSCDYDVVLTSVPHTFVLTIEAVGATAPRISPSAAVYDLCDPDDVEFTITWAGASSISQIRDITSLTTPSIVPGGGCTYPTQAWHVASNTLTICDWYMATAAAHPYFKYKMLECTFNDAASTMVNIYISCEWSDQPWIGVTSNIYTYDLDTGLGNLGALGVGALANFGCATNVTGVGELNEDGVVVYELKPRGSNACKCLGAIPTTYDYNIQYIPGYGHLVDVMPYYLGCTLTALGDSVELTIEFDAGENATMFINAVGTQPSISPTSAEFNLDDPQDVTTDVDLGCYDDPPVCHATDFDILGLTEGVDWWQTGDTVSINASYLSSVLAAVDDVVVLKFEFDEGDDANLTVRAVGTPLCFIATAAGADAPELDILREFRDVVLRPNSIGAKLVSLYYEASPPIAELISQNEALKAAVKVCLIDPIVAILNWSQCLWS